MVDGHSGGEKKNKEKASGDVLSCLESVVKMKEQDKVLTGQA